MPTKIVTFRFESTTREMVMFGLLGQLIKFLLAGSDAHVMWTVNVCNSCRQKSTLWRILEWGYRWTGIALPAYMLISLSTSNNPLVTQGIGTHLLVFSPLPLGVVMALVCQRYSVKSKGIVLIREQGATRTFRVRSQKWLTAYNASKTEWAAPEPVLADASGQPPMMPSSLGFWHDTWSAWRHGTLSSISDTYAKQASKSWDEFHATDPDLKSESMAIFLRAVTPQQGEFLIGYDDGDQKPPFVLTNRRLWIYNELTARHEDLPLSSIADCRTTGWWTMTIWVRFQDGSERGFHSHKTVPSEAAVRLAIRFNLSPTAHTPPIPTTTPRPTDHP